MMIPQVQLEGFGFFTSRVEHIFSFHTDLRELIFKVLWFPCPWIRKIDSQLGQFSKYCRNTNT